MKKVPYLLYPEINIRLPPFFTTDILEKSLIIECQENEQIVKAGEPLAFLFFIVAGKAKIIKNESNGKRIILQFLEAEDLIGDLSVAHAEKQPKEVVAIGKVKCLAIPIECVENHLMQNLTFLKYLNQYIGQKLLKRMEHFSMSQTFELNYRLANLLLSASAEGVYQENHVQVSEYLGVSYRHLLHTFKFFRENGYISKSKEGYILDSEKLSVLIQEVENK